MCFVFKGKLKSTIKEFSNLTFRVVSWHSLSQSKEPDCGTGFVFLKDQNKIYILTCLHVVLSVSSLAEVETIIKRDGLVVGKDSYREFYEKYVNNVQVELATNSGLQEAELEDFLYERDLAILSAPIKNVSRIVTFDFSKPILGSRIGFCGFPITPDYKDKTKFPFTVNEGIISAFSMAKPNSIYEFEHLQLNAVNLGGNSGAAVFTQNNGEVIGIIDGNMTNQITITNTPVYDPKGNIFKGNINLPPMVFSGVSYAIPIYEVKGFLEDFIKSVSSG